MRVKHEQAYTSLSDAPFIQHRHRNHSINVKHTCFFLTFGENLLKMIDPVKMYHRCTTTSLISEKDWLLKSGNELLDVFKLLSLYNHILLFYTSSAAPPSGCFFCQLPKNPTFLLFFFLFLSSECKMFSFLCHTSS